MRASIIVLAACMAAGGCHRSEAADSELDSGVEHFWVNRPSIAGMPEFQAMANGTRSADSVVFSEGLPRPTGSDDDVFTKELATKKVTQLHGWPFYEQPLVLDSQDLEKLRSACSDPENYRMPYAVTMCGGFHPDYQLSWQQGDRRFDYQFCFGCGETRLFLGDTLTLSVDIKTSVLVPLLEKYSAQRPPHRPFPR